MLKTKDYLAKRVLMMMLLLMMMVDRSTYPTKVRL